jgi:hypothetical protein
MDLQQVREWAAHEDHAISFFVGEPESDSADAKAAKREAWAQHGAEVEQSIASQKDRDNGNER